MDGVDSDTFNVLDSGYAIDEFNVYYLGDLLENADLETFESLGGDYAKDKNFVYFDGYLMEETDLPTFETILRLIPEEDGDEYYYYGKDKNHVYNFGLIIKEANPNECTVETIDKCDP